MLNAFAIFDFCTEIENVISEENVHLENNEGILTNNPNSMQTSWNKSTAETRENVEGRDASDAVIWARPSEFMHSPCLTDGFAADDIEQGKYLSEESEHRVYGSNCS